MKKKILKKQKIILLTLLILILIAIGTVFILLQPAVPQSIKDLANEICGGINPRVYQCSSTIYRVGCIGIDLPSAYIDVNGNVICKFIGRGRIEGVCPENLVCDRLVYAG